jgi:predicted  nucleic acid-binding Zn-ribbon protein
MTLEELQVVITANVAPMLQGLKEAQASLQDVSKAAASTGQQATSAVTKAATQTSKALQSSDAAQKDSVEAAKQAEQAKSQSMEEIADIAERAAARYNESLNSMGNGSPLHEPVQLTGASGIATGAANTAAAPQDAPAIDTEPQMNALQKLQAMALQVKQSLAGMFSGTSQEAPAASEALETLTAKLDNINARADLQRQKLAQLQAEYDEVASSAGAQSPAATQLQEQILNTEARLQSLTAQSDKTAAAIADLNAGLEDTGAAGGKAAAGAEEADSGFKAASSGASGFEQSLGRIQAQIFRNLIVYGLLIKGIQSLGTYMFNALDTNTAFANSLNNLKVQFLTAFNPIYQAILPALTSLINALAKAMTYIAAFISGFFGTTYAQSQQSADGLNKNVTALQNLAAAAKAAKSSVSGFDEVNTLTKSSDASSGSSTATDAGLTNTNFGAASAKPLIDPQQIADAQAAGAKIKAIFDDIYSFVKKYEQPIKDVIIGIVGAFLLFKTITFVSGIVSGIAGAFATLAANPAVAVALAIAAIVAALVILYNTNKQFHDEVINAWDEIKKTFSTGFDFSGIKTGLSDLQKAFLPFAENVGAGLAWALQNVLAPLAKWVVNDVVPAYLNILSGTFDVLNSVIVTLEPLALWLFNNFLKPIAEWTGGIVVEVLNGIGDGLKGISDWISAHQAQIQGVITNVTSVLGTLRDLVKDLWTNILQPFFDNVGKVATDLWNSHLKGLLDNICFR